MGTSDTLRSVIDAGQSSKRLDELSSARVVGKVARQIHAAQQRAGAGKAVGPVTPAHIKLLPSGEATLELGGGSALGYSSPEQIEGGAGDRRSDVFSLGAVLWEALTYARLFDAMNDAAVKAAVKERAITAPAEINANVPAELSAICMRALSRNPTDRYQSLKAMAVEIEEFLEEAGYADSDEKIASYLKALHAPPQAKKAAPAPAETHAKGTKPPPNVLVQPAAPSMLGEPPSGSRPKTPTGADIAAALANAAAAAASTTGETALPRAQAAVTAVGVPKLAEWQDASTPAHAPPPAAAPVVSVENVEPASAASSPSVPLPPVLPSGSASLQTDRSTIAASVPPQVKVETVNTKAQAQSAETKPATAGAATPIETPENAKATLVDTKPPEIEVPKLVDGTLPDAANAGAASSSGAAGARASSQSDAAKTRASSQSDAASTRASSQSDAASTRASSQSDAASTRASSQPGATRGRAASKSDATGRRAPSHSDAVPRGAAGTKSSPHPAAAVSLGPIPGGRDSKDVLAGWGWGTDKHDAITDGYADDDYDSDTQRSKKMLTYLIGGGLALAALVTVVALAFGGSSNNKDTKTVAKQTETARPAIDQPSATAPGALDPTAQPAAAATAEGSAAAEGIAGSADGSAAASAANADGSAATADGSTPGAGSGAEQAEADHLAAEKAEADRLAAEKTEADRLAAEQAEADRLVAEQAKKDEAARLAAEKQAKKEEATRLAAEKAEARKAEAARVAAEKKAKKEEAARLAAEKAEARKAEAARVAAERKAKREAAAQRAGTKNTTHTTKTARKTVASAEAKGDAQAAYRTGIQQYARGDTSGALASLRKARAANPSYAPTWRGLGLVYEKMGEKAQARAAYKRYLQLAPGAGDAPQIRARLERLGS